MTDETQNGKVYTRIIPKEVKVSRPETEPEGLQLQLTCDHLEGGRAGYIVHLSARHLSQAGLQILEASGRETGKRIARALEGICLNLTLDDKHKGFRNDNHKNALKGICDSIEKTYRP